MPAIRPIWLPDTGASVKDHDTPIRLARELVDAGDRLAPTDLPGALRKYLAARDHLMKLGLKEAAAAVLMDCTSAARTHDDRHLAMRFCRRASRDDPSWGDPLATLALLETELANASVEREEITRALRLYSRAARHHAEAARVMRAKDPESADRQLRFEAFIRARRGAVAEWAKADRQRSKAP
jgi:hypothetical protein